MPVKVSGRLKHMGESQMGDKKRQAGKRYFTSELFYTHDPAGYDFCIAV